MSFMTRVRMAIVRWWVRSVSDAHVRQRELSFEDLEGIGRSLARPRTGEASDPSPPVSVARKREARFPNRLVIRFE